MSDRNQDKDKSADRHLSRKLIPTKSEIMITPDIIRVIILRTRDLSLRIESGLIIGLGVMVRTTSKTAYHRRSLIIRIEFLCFCKLDDPLLFWGRAMVMGNKESISYNQTSENSKLDVCEYICEVSGLYDLFEKLAFDPRAPPYQAVAAPLVRGGYTQKSPSALLFHCSLSAHFP